jgi:LmbE family N-acetylglucosaminyl deacetylase
MRPLSLLGAARGEKLSILCLGAHCDDIDIGCGGALLALLDQHAGVDVTWVAFSAHGERAKELHRSARRFLRKAGSSRVVTREYRDGFLPAHFTAVKEDFESLKRLPQPAVIFTHRRDDRHQDHRLVAELTWNTFRSHLILEYEVVKYEGDLATPSAYVSLKPAQMERKIRILLESYRTQREKRWFTADTFRGLMRLRGIESGAPSGWAEGFYASKLLLS